VTTAEFERTERHLTVRLSGELDQDTVPDLTARILAGMEAEDEDVTLDLGAVTFCDSAGIAMLVTAHQHAGKLGAGLSLHNPSPILKATFAVCGLTDLLPITSDP
jgi:anti-anti-sigma factor